MPHKSLKPHELTESSKFHQLDAQYIIQISQTPMRSHVNVTNSMNNLNFTIFILNTCCRYHELNVFQFLTRQNLQDCRRRMWNLCKCHELRESCVSHELSESSICHKLNESCKCHELHESSISHELIVFHIVLLNQILRTAVVARLRTLLFESHMNVTNSTSRLNITIWMSFYMSRNVSSICLRTLLFESHVNVTHSTRHLYVTNWMSF